ncbi:MAG TPA: hypothetical protein VFV66_26690 [Nonomuraea sp.]|nr:hypothetical protein [Nonomuraea sp.]
MALGFSDGRDWSPRARRDVRYHRAPEQQTAGDVADLRPAPLPAVPDEVLRRPCAVRLDR